MSNEQPPKTWQDALSRDPLHMSTEHRAAMDKDLGPVEARQRRMAAVANIRITPERNWRT